MTGQAKHVAAIDIGTNSVRLLVLSSDGRELEREMAITRLGQGVDDSGRLSEAAMARTLEVLRSYAQLVKRHAVDSLRMTATSAARDADNRADFFARVRAVMGQEPELLPGSEEARLSFLGATAKLGQEHTWVVFDIGGGSTEFARGTHSPERFVSLDIGAVRITERFLASDPPTPDEVARATKYVRAELERARQTIAPEASDAWLGLAGTVTTFAAHLAGVSSYDASKTHGLSMSARQIQDFAERLLGTTTNERRPLLMEPKRAEVIIGGAVILSSIVEHFGLSRVQCSERDILDGLAASLLS